MTTKKKIKDQVRFCEMDKGINLRLGHSGAVKGKQVKSAREDWTRQ